MFVKRFRIMKHYSVLLVIVSLIVVTTSTYKLYQIKLYNFLTNHSIQQYLMQYTILYQSNPDYYADPTYVFSTKEIQASKWTSNGEDYQMSVDGSPLNESSAILNSKVEYLAIEFSLPENVHVETVGDSTYSIRELMFTLMKMIRANALNNSWNSNKLSTQLKHVLANDVELIVSDGHRIALQRCERESHNKLLIINYKNNQEVNIYFYDSRRLGAHLVWAIPKQSRMN